MESRNFFTSRHFFTKNDAYAQALMLQVGALSICAIGHNANVSQLACLGVAAVGLEPETVGRVAVMRGAMQPWRAARWYARFRLCRCRHAVCPLVGKFREFVMPIGPMQKMRAVVEEAC